MNKNIIFLAIIVPLCLDIISNANAQIILTGGFGTDGMGVVNGTAYAKTGTLGSGGFPFVSAARDGSAFYASASGKLYFIDAAATAFTDSISINLSRISSSNEANILFGNTSKSLVRINTSTKSVVDSVVLGAPWEITERPNAKEVWVTDSSRVHIIDYTTTLSVTNMAISASPFDNSKVAFTPGGSVGYKGASASKKLYKINPSAKTIIDSVSTAPYGLSNMVVSHDSSKLFVCNPNNNTIRIYNTSDLSITDSINCGSRDPINIYRHPVRNEIWAVNHFNDSVSVYDENTKTLIAAFNISGSPWYIAFGGNASTEIHSYSRQEPINLFPNPAQNGITVAGLNPGDRISILNIAGRNIRSQTASGKTIAVDISAFVTGTYMLIISGADGGVRKYLEFEKK